jgi:hypothetical protein
VIGKTEVIIRREHQNPFAIDDDGAILLAFDGSQFPVKPPFLEIVDLILKKGILHGLTHRAAPNPALKMK